MTEGDIWEELSRGMGLLWLADRIENKFNTGIPDVTFTVPKRHGWIELKAADIRDTCCVVRPKKPVDNRQRHWLRTRGCAAENTYILIGIQIGSKTDRVEEYYLLNWRQGIELTESKPYLWFKDNCLWRGKGRIYGLSLYSVLIGG